MVCFFVLVLISFYFPDNSMINWSSIITIDETIFEEGTL